MVNATAATSEQSSVSHNLLGQRLGRKGRDTRERILAATARLLAEPSDTPISLSAVAREAALGMTSLYPYFSDLTELLLAALEPIMESAEDVYIAHLRTRWPDKALFSHCLVFVRAFHAFWQRHTRILHLRNSLADANDIRLRIYRVEVALPVMRLLAIQMDGEHQTEGSPAAHMATVLLTGTERLITVTTDASSTSLTVQVTAAHVDNLLKAQARLLSLAIRDRRDEIAKLDDGSGHRPGPLPLPR